MRLVNTTMLTQTCCVILVYSMSLHKGNNNIVNLYMLHLSIQALHSVTTLIEICSFLLDKPYDILNAYAKIICS